MDEQYDVEAAGDDWVVRHGGQVVARYASRDLAEEGAHQLAGAAATRHPTAELRSAGPASLVPGHPEQPSERTKDQMVSSTPIGEDDTVVRNESRGPAAAGGGYFPDPDAPPTGSAPADGSPERGKGSHDEAYESVGRDAAGVGSTTPTDEEAVTQEDLG